MKSPQSDVWRIQVVGGHVSDEEVAALALVLMARQRRTSGPPATNRQALPSWRRTGRAGPAAKTGLVADRSGLLPGSIPHSLESHLSGCPVVDHGNGQAGDCRRSSRHQSQPLVALSAFRRSGRYRSNLGTAMAVTIRPWLV